MSSKDPMATPNLPASQYKILAQAIGNPSRGDDALGPRLIEELEKRVPTVDCEWVYQLQIEQAEQWSHYDAVVLIDAHAQSKEPFQWTEMLWSSDMEKQLGVTSHQVSPQSIIAMNYRYFQAHPRVFLLALQGESFELGAEMSEVANAALTKGLEFLTDLLVCDESGITKFSSECQQIRPRSDA